MPVNLSVSLPNFNNDFRKNIIAEVRSMIIKSMPAITSAIKERLGVELFDAISSSETWKAVKGGVLRGELGIPNVASLDRILETWANGIQVDYEQNKELGVIKIGMLRSDYSDVLSLPEASFPYAGRNSSGVIEWLRWLLLESTQIIITDYNFYSKGGYGRTGMGIMIKTGSGWSVPTQYAGSAVDNFATRSLHDIRNVIDKVVNEEVNRRL